MYQVLDWNKWFENDRSRKVDHCSFVCVPNKQHGMGISYILSLPNGLSIYGVWSLVLGALSQQRRPRDGWLSHDGTRSGSPWTIEEMALRWRRSLDEISDALKVLCSQRVMWMVCDSHVSLTPHSRHTPIEGMEGRKEQKEECAAETQHEPTAATREDAERCQGFDNWWAAWPKHHRKVTKADCKRFWIRHGLEKIAEQVIASLERCKASRDWTKDNGEFIPMPRSWLNKTPWETDPAERVELPQGGYEFTAKRPSSAEVRELIGGEQ